MCSITVGILTSLDDIYFILSVNTEVYIANDRAHVCAFGIHRYYSSFVEIKILYGLHNVLIVCIFHKFDLSHLHMLLLLMCFYYETFAMFLDNLFLHF